MTNKELYKIAYNHINHIDLKQFGTAGHVACALESKEGNIFTGICIDLPCSIGLCAEQSAIAEMIKNNETVINKIIAVYEDGSILPPCGRCREFISQIDNENTETIIVLPELEELPLKDLLPESWDKKMELIRFTDRIFYLPHEEKTDRPLLAYIKGEKFSLAIDAGNSADHVDEFYKSLEAENLKKPEVTIITHWHWDHTFGMHNINGLSIAHKKTNEFLKAEQDKFKDTSYLDILKRDNKYIAREYSNNKDSIVTLSDIEFDKELVINLGDISAEIFHTQAPHSEDTVLIYIPKEKVLFLGDSTSENFFNNNYMDINKLKSLIETIGKIECKTCILGHAEPLDKNDLLDYLESLL